MTRIDALLTVRSEDEYRKFTAAEVLHLRRPFGRPASLRHAEMVFSKSVRAFVMTGTM